MRIRHIYFYLAFTLILQGCSGEWPPYYGRLSENYNKNKAAFERLNQKMRESEYTSVARYSQRDGSHIISGITARRPPAAEIKDDGEWRHLFDQTKLSAIEINSGEFEFHPYSEVIVDEKKYKVNYVRVESGLRKDCQPSHAKISCGKCYAPLDEVWGIKYFWTDLKIFRRVNKRIEAGELSWLEKQAIVDEEVRRCRTKGYAEIGYVYEP